MKGVSLYIPAYNAAPTLALCLEAVLQQSYPIDEIVVVDDGSSDHTAEVAAGINVKLIKHGNNKGVAAARNTGIRETRNDFVAAIDSDCIVEPDWLEKCMKNFSKPGVAAVGGKLIEIKSSRIIDSWRALHLKHHWGDGKLVNPDFLSGSNLVLRHDAVEQVGEYNEKFSTNYEDVEFSRRVREKGFDLVYESEAIARHIREDTIKSLLVTFWSWHYHLFNKRWSLRISFLLLKSAKMFFEDIIRGRIRCSLLDILTFPASVYLDIKDRFCRKPTGKDS